MKSVVKNYRTGKEYVEIKHKPDLPIKGRANVYIYNARTGALEVEAHTPNIIYPEVYQWLRSYQWDKFCAGAFNKTNSYSGYWEMDNIFLTASDKPETERINILNYNATGTGNPGQLIGWANKSTYSGSDTQRGTPNSVETYANNSRVHWVFDWPTHAGNGTFQTIIWGNQITPYGASETIKQTELEAIPNSGYDIVSDGTYLYASKYDGTIYKLNKQGNIVNTFSTGIYTYYKDATRSMNITTDGNFLYLIKNNDFNYILYKVRFDGVVVSYSDVNISVVSTEANLGIAFDGTYFYGLDYKGNLYKFLGDGTILGSVATGISSHLNSGFSLVYNTHLYALAWDGTLYKLTTDGVVLGSANIGIRIEYNWYNTILGIAYDGSDFYVLTNNGIVYKTNLADHYFARTRLAAPVTKTNQQTMKIQYDFIYEE